VNLQPIIDVLAGRLVQALLVLTWLVGLFGTERVAAWIEAIGAEGVGRLFGVAQ
jgi:hypothetical protein